MVHTATTADKPKAADRDQQRAEIRRCLASYHQPGDVFEIRAVDVPSGRYKNIVSGWFNDFDLAAAAAQACDSRGATGVYVTINPCDPALLALRNNRTEDRVEKTTKDQNIIRRRRLAIDIDPTRGQTGVTGIMATDQEQEVARELAVAAEDLLRGEKFSYPLLAESGSGMYLGWPIDLPNDEETLKLLKDFYAALKAALPSSGVSIDQTLCNASRILRIGGTWNRKGDGTPDRPHRPCHYFDPIADCPVDLVPVETIRAFVAKYAPKPETKSKSSTNGNGRYDRLDVGRYLSDRGVTFKEKATGKGTAFQVPCPFNEDHGARGESAVLQEADGTLSYKCMHDGCSSRRWSDYRDMIGKPDDGHYDPPRQRVDAAKVVKQGLDRPKANGQAAAPVLTKMVTRSYEGIELEDVIWLWRDRFPLGKLSLVAGVAGVGKTFFLCDTIARCSIGGKFPDGSVAPLCESLILTAEDGAGDTIKPRLVAHGADCSKVHHYDRIDIGGNEAYFTLTGYLDVLRTWLQEHPAVKLIVFDPITAFMGDKIDSHKNAEVRAALGPLCKLAEELGVAIIGITHLSKGQAKAINRVIGSVAFVAAARACWLVDWDPEEDGRRLFLPVKNNLAHADGLAYTITDGAIVWEQGAVTITADDLSDTIHTTPREEAEGWLRQALQAGRVPSAKMAAEAKREGISERTLNRAKKQLHVVSERDGPTWYWKLPGVADFSGITSQESGRKFDFGEHNG